MIRKLSEAVRRRVGLYGLIISASFAAVFLFIFFDQVMSGEVQSSILGLFNNPNLGIRIVFGLLGIFAVTLVVEKKLFPAQRIEYELESEMYVCPANDKHRFTIPGYYYSFKPPKVIYMCPTCWNKQTMTSLWEDPLVLQNVPRALIGIPGINAKLGEATPEQIETYFKQVEREAKEVIEPKETMPGWPRPCGICKVPIDSPVKFRWHMQKEHKKAQPAPREVRTRTRNKPSLEEAEGGEGHDDDSNT